MLFDNWYGLVRATVVGIGAYAGLVFVLRVSGKRTLTKMNAFDLVVTVALGSTLATVLLNESVSLAEGLVAFTPSSPVCNTPLPGAASAGRG